MTVGHSTKRYIQYRCKHTHEISIIKESSSFHLLCQINWFSRCDNTLRFNLSFLSLTLFFLFSFFRRFFSDRLLVWVCLLSLALLLFPFVIYIWPSIVFSFAHRTTNILNIQQAHSFALNKFFATVLQIYTNEQLTHPKWLRISNEMNENQCQISMHCRELSLSVCAFRSKIKSKMNYGFRIPLLFIIFDRMNSKKRFVSRDAWKNRKRRQKNEKPTQRMCVCFLYFIAS